MFNLFIIFSANALTKYEKMRYTLVIKQDFGGTVKKVIFFLINALTFSNIFASSSVETEIMNDLKNAKTINELLAVLLLLLIWLLYRYKMRHLSEKQKKEELHSLVYSNELTKLPNRNRYYLDEKEGIFKKTEGTFVTLYIDNISRFYEMYESDKVGTIIKELGEILSKRDEISHIYHYDSGTFILILDNINEQKAKEFCKELSSDAVLTIRESISLSFGIHELKPYVNLKEIYRMTRVAARLAKRFSYEKILLASHQEIEKYKDSLKIEEDLPRALMENEFVPFFQPKIDLNTNEIVGCEALIRWNHFSGNVIYPDRFISIAEENNTIIDLDLLVAEKSIIIVKDWLEKGVVKENFKLSFNLSSKTFISPGIMLKIMTILGKYNFNPKNLEIELTETIVISDYDHFSKIIQELNALGINISLDDFTAGYSSTEYLTKLKIDAVKLDRGLIIGTEFDDENGLKKRGMYKMLVQMIKQLGLSVVSEGLDNERHLDLLMESGVEIAQGYYFSKPLSESEFINFLNKKD